MTKKLVALFALLLLPSAAFAGRTGALTSSCTKNTDGSGSCSGTLAGFRALPDQSSWAQFAYTGDGSFSASYNGLSGTYCFATSGNIAMWPQLATMPTTAFFYVAWDANRNCTSVQMYNVSYY
jgi:hypothetical protein